MRNPIILLLLLFPTFSFARQGDTTFYRHQLAVSETDGISHLFADGRSGPTTLVVSQPTLTRTDTRYLPNYVLHIHFKYSLGITRNVRLETGLGYMFEGLSVKATAYPPIYIWSDYYTGYIFTRKFTVPVYVKFIKRIGAGAFTCTVGPEFTFPVNSFFKKHHLQPSGGGTINTTERVRYTSLQTFYESSMGVNLKLGHETYFRYSTVDVGAVVNFSDLVLMDKALSQDYRASGYRPYHYYIGVDVAVYFGIKGKKK